MSFLFWLCAFGATYSYLWYPVLLIILPARRLGGNRAASNATVGRAAIVIAARNEAEKIDHKIENTLALDRAGIALDIIVASDASDDATDQIVGRYADRGVRLIRPEARRGKEYAQGLAVASTESDLIIFTDAGVSLRADALVHLVRAFRDPDVGAVSSVDGFLTADGSLQGEGAYVRYEMWLRDLETRFFSLVGLSGSFFAARKSVCIDWDHRVSSDFGTALNCVRAGMRAVSDREVIGYYKNIADPRKEYQRKLRTVVRGMRSLLVRRDVLNLAKFGRFSFQVFSHKVMRWAVPWFLLGALITSAFLSRHMALYRGILAAEALLYLSPVACSLVPVLRRIGAVRLAVFFVETNLAIARAAVLTLSGRSILQWEPSRR